MGLHSESAVFNPSSHHDLFVVFLYHLKPFPQKGQLSQELSIQKTSWQEERFAFEALQSQEVQ